MMRTFPRWVTFLFVAFMGFMLYQGTRPAPVTAPATSAITPAITEKTYPRLRALTDGDRWAKAINPDYIPPEDPCAARVPAADTVGDYAIVLNEGEGDVAACGDAVALRITSYNGRGAAQPVRDITVTLGEQPGFDALVLDQRVGEVRLLYLQPAARLKALPMLRPGALQVLRVERVAMPDAPVEPSEAATD
jgi:hypothetical protein